LIIESANKKNKPDSDSIIIMISLENLLKDIRNDIGHKNNNIKSGDILNLFLNDWEKFNN